MQITCGTVSQQIQGNGLNDSSNQIFGTRGPKLFYFPIRNFSSLSSELFSVTLTFFFFYVYRDIIKKKK